MVDTGYVSRLVVGRHNRFVQQVPRASAVMRGADPGRTARLLSGEKRGPFLIEMCEFAEDLEARFDLFACDFGQALRPELLYRK